MNFRPYLIRSYISPSLPMRRRWRPRCRRNMMRGNWRNTMLGCIWRRLLRLPLAAEALWLAGALDRALIARGRVEYALHWPLYLRSEFITLQQEPADCRMAVFGLDLEPSSGGSPSKRYWGKAMGLRKKCGLVGPRSPRRWLVRPLANTISLAIGPPRMRMPDLVLRPPRLRPLLPLLALVRDLALVPLPRLPASPLPPLGGILVLRK